MAITADEFKMNIQSSLYWLVNGIERAPRSNLARLSAISSFWTLFVEIYATKRKSCTVVPCMRAIEPLLYMYSNTLHLLLLLTITYHSLHLCSRQAQLCMRLAACHVPLVARYLYPPTLRAEPVDKGGS